MPLSYCQVSLTVVRRFVQAVSDQAVGTGVIRGVRPDQQLVKVYLTVAYSTIRFWQHWS